MARPSQPECQQYYAKVSPTKLAKKYEKAGYFERNVRTIEVLIDREAIVSGAAARGEPWQYYDSRGDDLPVWREEMSGMRE